MRGQTAGKGPLMERTVSRDDSSVDSDSCGGGGTFFMHWLEFP